jgi:hypothetical protein
MRGYPSKYCKIAVVGDEARSGRVVEASHKTSPQESFHEANFSRALQGVF